MATVASSDDRGIVYPIDGNVDPSLLGAISDRFSSLPNQIRQVYSDFSDYVAGKISRKKVEKRIGESWQSGVLSDGAVMSFYDKLEEIDSAKEIAENSKLVQATEEVIIEGFLNGGL